MKIVHIEDFIHPDAGYQVNLLSRLQAREGHEVVIVTAELHKVPSFLTEFFGKEDIDKKDRRFFHATGVRIIRVPLVGFYSGRAIFYPRHFRVVDSLDPDVIFVHGEDTLTGILYILRSTRLKYPIVLDCHMVEMASENRFRNVFRFFYRRIVTPRIIRNNIPLIRVVDVDYVEKCLGIPLGRTTLLGFGTDTTYFKPDDAARRAFRARHAIGADDFVVIYAGKLDASKGGRLLADALWERFPVHGEKTIVFVIVGNAVGDYGGEVERILATSQNRIIRFPTQTYPDLAEFYQAADLSVFPRQCSLSFFEAQSCGLPVLLENNEVNSQRAQGNNALLFRPGDVSSFRAGIETFACMERSELDRMKAGARQFALDNGDFVPIARKFTEILEKEVTRFRARRMGDGRSAPA